MDFNYMRKFCAYVSTFYHSKYVTLSPTVKTLIRRLPVFILQYQISGVRKLGLLQRAHRNTLGAKLCP